MSLHNLGSIAAIALAVLLLRRYRALPRSSRLPRYGLFGAALLIGSMLLNAVDVVIVEVFFTPLCWTGYILWADGAILALRGHSLLRAPRPQGRGGDARADGGTPGPWRREFLLLALCSIPLWLVFEAYNLRLHNWIYAGMPNNPAARLIGYAWAFATIWPGIFVTAALLRAMDWNAPPEVSPADSPNSAPLSPKLSPVVIPSEARNLLLSRAAEKNAGSSARQKSPDFGMTAGESSVLPKLSIFAGALFLAVPVIVPARYGAYMFGAVWLGVVLMLDPINMRLGRESLWGDLRHGDRSRLYALLWAGAICGILWEFWNWSAGARWVYTFPIFPRWRIFAMPVAGYLGFPVFALDCFAMYALIEPSLQRLARKPPGAPALLDL